MAITPEGVVKLEQQVYEEPILPRMDLTQQVPGVHSGLWWYAKYPLHVTESPSHATKEKGERMIEARVLDLADRLRAIKEDKVLPSLQQEFYGACAQGAGRRLNPPGEQSRKKASINKEVKRSVRGKSWRWQSHASLRSKVQATRRMPPKRSGEPLFHPRQHRTIHG